MLCFCMPRRLVKLFLLHHGVGMVSNLVPPFQAKTALKFLNHVTPVRKVDPFTRNSGRRGLESVAVS